MRWWVAAGKRRRGPKKAPAAKAAGRPSPRKSHAAASRRQLPDDFRSRPPQPVHFRTRPVHFRSRMPVPIYSRSWPQQPAYLRKRSAYFRSPPPHPVYFRSRPRVV
eukprot:scaffold5032_cov88-Isochrysis_galbana.AAC.6